MRLTFIILGVLLLLAACAPQLTGTRLDLDEPTNAQPPIVTAPPTSGLETAENACSSPCSLGETCENGRCLPPIPRCNYLERLNIENRSCDCAPDTKWCGAQAACIPAKACCAHTDCAFRDNECGESTVAITTCLTDGPTLCKQLRPGITERFDLTRIHTVRVNKLLEGGALDARLDQTDIDAYPLSETRTIAGITFNTEKVTVYTGQCRLKR